MAIEGGKAVPLHQFVALGSAQVLPDHLGDQLGKRRARHPAQLLPGLGRVAEQGFHFGGTKIARIDGNGIACGKWEVARSNDIFVAHFHEKHINAAFPFYTAQDIGIGMTPAKALRISYVGELGWEIYAPASYGLQLWDALWEAGRAFGMPTVGIAALLSLRLEKGYRLYGADMTTDYNPYEAGLGWMVKHHKGDFVGREAALAAKQAGAKKKLVCLTFADPQAIMYGYEPVFVDGKVVGRITSGDYGYSVGKFIAYAYVDATKAAVGTKVNVRYTGRFFDGEVAAEPLFDKGMLRLRG